ncbi:MAG: DUF1722 domain-containing protein [Gammaproteobacteria bacterium]|nr:DUF1722 domain-containing protein [Gammaproteobacteria bacterium]MCB1924028.1 DUF1722 domain-containing protein [Gammaproteobacteria bacterium]
MTYAERPVIGISSCLLGQKVRYDGTAKRDHWIVERLGKYVDYRPVCPEVAIGLGTPRPPIRLVGTPESTRVIGVEDPSVDVTEALEDFALNTAAQLRDISGYVLMSKSPSCGMERVKLYNARGQAEKKGVGAYARVLMQALPNLPFEEEGRLNDAVLRENFINRVFAYRRWQTLRGNGLTAKALLDFHARHKYMVMAHSQAAYQRLGRLLSHLKGVDLAAVADAYEAEFMAALKRRVGRKRHVNALQHIQGYLKQRIDSDDKQELSDSIEAYRREEVPLVVPMKLLRHYFRRHPDNYIDQQWYLDPYPESLGLRNAI